MRAFKRTQVRRGRTVPRASKSGRCVRETQVCFGSGSKVSRKKKQSGLANNPFDFQNVPHRTNYGNYVVRLPRRNPATIADGIDRRSGLAKRVGLPPQGPIRTTACQRLRRDFRSLCSRPTEGLQDRVARHAPPSAPRHASFHCANDPRPPGPGLLPVRQTVGPSVSSDLEQQPPRLAVSLSRRG